jgi:hypothetical protein
LGGRSSLRQIGNDACKQSSIKSNAKEYETRVSDNPFSVSETRKSASRAVYPPLVSKQWLTSPPAKRDEPDDNPPRLNNDKPQHASENLIHKSSSLNAQVEKRKSAALILRFLPGILSLPHPHLDDFINAHSHYIAASR